MWCVRSCNYAKFSPRTNEAIRALMNPPQPKRRSIGFTADL
jgi:hypothetical protein